MEKRKMEHNAEPKQSLDKRGREVLDVAPANVSVRRQKMVGLSDQMRQVVMQMRHEAVQAENDSLEDEKDFDLESDEPRSPHELFVETPEYEMFLDDIVEFSRKKKSSAESSPAEPKSPSPKEPLEAAPEAEKGKK